MSFNGNGVAHLQFVKFQLLIAVEISGLFHNVELQAVTVFGFEEEKLFVDCLQHTDEIREHAFGVFVARGSGLTATLATLTAGHALLGKGKLRECEDGE